MTQADSLEDDAPGDEPGAPSRMHLEVGFAIGVVLACIVAGVFLMGLSGPRPDEVLLPPSPRASTPPPTDYAGAPITRDGFSVHSEGVPVAQVPRVAITPTTTPSPRATGRSSTPTKRPQPTRSPIATVPPKPGATPAPTRAPQCIVTLLGVRICIP